MEEAKLQISLSEEILTDIVEKDIPFNEALRMKFQPRENEALRKHRAFVAGLVGCELRHHLLFEALLTPIEGLDEAEKRFVALSLANVYYFKRIAYEEMLEIVKERLGEEKLALVLPLFEKALAEVRNFMPEDIGESWTDRYLSIRFNCPEWVMKVWAHYGRGAMGKILKKNARPATITVRLGSPIEPKAFYEANPDFKPSTVEGIAFYEGKEPLRRHPDYANGNIWLERPATKALLDKLPLEEPSEALVYAGSQDSSLLLEAVEQYGKLGLNLGCKSLNEHVAVSRHLKKQGLKTVNFFEANTDSMLSAVSRPVDLAIVAPNSSAFDLIRESPDFLLHFKKDKMEEAYKEEKASLENVSNFVALGGKLVYCIYTISQLEGHRTVNAFLDAHKEYRLVEEKQIFPYEELDTAMYYAILEKVGEVSVDPVTSAPEPVREAPAYVDPAMPTSLNGK